MRIQIILLFALLDLTGCASTAVHHIATSKSEISIKISGNNAVYISDEHALTCIESTDNEIKAFFSKIPLTAEASYPTNIKPKKNDQLENCDPSKFGNEIFKKLPPCEKPDRQQTKYITHHDFLKGTNAGQCFLPLGTNTHLIYIENNDKDITILNGGIEGSEKPYLYSLDILAIPFDVITSPIQLLFLLPWAPCFFGSGCR